MSDSFRRLVAWFAAPVVGVMAVAAMLTFLNVFEGRQGSPLGWLVGGGEITIVLLLYATPVAFVAELLIGAPVYHLLSSRHRLWLGSAIAVGAAAGFVAFPVSTALTFAGWSWGLAAIGAVAGAFAGAAFWRLAPTHPAVPRGGS